MLDDSFADISVSFGWNIDALQRMQLDRVLEFRKKALEKQRQGSIVNIGGYIKK